MLLTEQLIFKAFIQMLILNGDKKNIKPSLSNSSKINDTLSNLFVYHYRFSQVPALELEKFLEDVR